MANGQLDIFAGEEARDAAIVEVAKNAEPWIARIVDLVRAVPIGRDFTTDELWRSSYALGLCVGEPRAMGAAIMEAKAKGLIEGTGTYRKSTRKECNARPVLVWRRR